MININKLRTPREPIYPKPILKEPDIFKSEDELKNSAKHIFYGDLYIMGRIWIETLQSVLIGSKFSIFKIPAVKAAPKDESPSRPSPMPASDLPLYSSPHRNFNEYMEDQSLCRDVNVKTLHNFMFPYVSSVRKGTQEFCKAVRYEFNDTCNDVKWHYRDKKAKILRRMRDPNNMAERGSIVAIGALVGYVYAHKNRANRVFYTTLGLLATGALCFPKDTDAIFKQFCYHSAKGFLTFYNNFYDKSGSFRESLPCKDSIIVEPKKNPGKGNPCPIPGKK